MDSDGDMDPFQNDEETEHEFANKQLTSEGKNVDGNSDLGSKASSVDLRVFNKSTNNSEGFILSQTFRQLPNTPTFKTPKTRKAIVNHWDSDDDIFATSVATPAETQLAPSGLMSLLDREETSNLSWTSSMATPLTGNVTYSNLNTEERKVLLPSADCNQIQPRALFSPDANDTVECDSLNLSSEVDVFSALKDKNKSCNTSSLSHTCSSVKKAEKRKRRRIHCGLVQSPDNKKSCPENEYELPRSASPVISGSNSIPMKICKMDEDIFQQSDINESKSGATADLSYTVENNSSYAESTPLNSSRKSLSHSRSSSTTNEDNFPLSVSDTELKELDQNRKIKHPVTTPLHPEYVSKKKRILFKSSSGAKSSETNLKNVPEEADTTALDNACHCIQDALEDSYTEKLAGINTSEIFNMNTMTNEGLTKVNLLNKAGNASGLLENDNCFHPSESIMKKILQKASALESNLQIEPCMKSFKSSEKFVMFNNMLGYDDAGNCNSTKTDAKFLLETSDVKLEENSHQVSSHHSKADAINLNDSHKTQADREIQLLLQLVNNGEELSPWHETDSGSLEKSIETSDTKVQDNLDYAKSMEKIANLEYRNTKPVINQGDRHITTATNQNAKFSNVEEPGNELEKSFSDLHDIPDVSKKITGRVSAFKTASGKKVEVSEESLSKAKLLLQEDCDTEETGSPLDTEEHFERFRGFKTASGKIVEVSEESLTKAKLLLQEDCDIEETGSPLDTEEHFERFSGFKTASGKIVEVSEESLTKAKLLLQEDCVQENVDFKCPVETKRTKQNTEGFSGFKTASGRKVEVSEESISKAKLLFQEDSDMGDTGFNSNLDVKNKETYVLRLFQTASGKNVEVSEESLTKAKLLFQENEDFGNTSFYPYLEVKKTKTNAEAEVFRGFQTASGKKVEVSDESLSKAKLLFLEDCDLKSTGFISNLDTKIDETFDGFKTASGKKVEISEESLSKAKLLFKEENDWEKEALYLHLDTVESKANNGFKIASGKEIEGSEESLSQEGNSKDSPNFANLKKFEETPDTFLKFQKRSMQSSVPIKKDEKLSLSSALVSTPIINKSKVFGDIGLEQPSAECDSGYETTLISMTGSSAIVEKSDESVNCSLNHRTKLSNFSASDLRLSCVEKSICATSSNTVQCVQTRNYAYATDCKNQCFDLNQEVSESTAALLADEEFCSNLESLIDIKSSVTCSPSSIGDRTRFQPVVSSVDNIGSCKENSLPTSPILGKNDRKGFRRSFRKNKHNLYDDKLTTWKTEEKKDISFVIDDPAAPTKLAEKATSKINFLSRANNGTPLVLNRSELGRIGGASSTPTNNLVCKISTSEPRVLPAKKRCLNFSPMTHDVSAKRPKSLDVTERKVLEQCRLWTPNSFDEDNDRTLRPEVAEMRQRAADEQKKLVSNDGAAKGTLLKPVIGSLYARKVHDKESQCSWSQLVQGRTPGKFTVDQLKKVGVKACVLQVNAANAGSFRFSAWDFYSSDRCRENVSGVPIGDGALLILDSNGHAGIEEFERAFLASPGVDPSLVPSGWIQNHYRWIVWKLACMERSFPYQFASKCFNPHTVMQQLKYRYDREIDHSQRPALRRILEHDDNPGKRLILCVCGIHKNEEGSKIEVDLTDGWYCIRAIVDQEMQNRIARGRIEIGTKLCMHSAELVNSSEGCHPLEARSDIRLRLFSNSTRRARWHSKLGFHPDPGPMNISLGSVLGSGGLISSVNAYIARVYPLIYMEKTPDKTVVRCQRAEAKEETIREREKHNITERIYIEVQDEVQREEVRRPLGKQRKFNKSNRQQINMINSGEELCALLESDPDPSALQCILTDEQRLLMENHHSVKQERLMQDIEKRVQEKLKSIKNSEKQITPILKIRLVSNKENGHKSSAILSIWRPPEDMTQMLKEGSFITVLGATANGFRCGELQLSANKSTQYSLKDGNGGFLQSARCITALSRVSETGFTPLFGELDVVGIVVHIGSPPKTEENSSHFQVVYISDAESRMMGISFWGGIKAFGLEDFFHPQTIVAATNLQWRSGPVVNLVPCVYASELTVFSANPRQSYLKTAVKDLQYIISKDPKTFVQTCREKLKLQEKTNPASSLIRNPGIVSSPGPSISSRMLSPIPTTSFRSPFKQSSELDVHMECSPAVERRLARLDMYGRPPALPPIILSTPGKDVRREFRVPLKTSTEPSNRPAP